MLNKSDEIKILRATVAQLGNDSYCGPWLSQNIPAIEHDIRSDVEPTSDYSATCLVCAAKLADAKAEAERIVSQARKDAEQIMDAAFKRAESIRAHVASVLRRSLKEIES